MIDIMISQPMNGKTRLEIGKERMIIGDKVKKLFFDIDINIMDTTVPNHENKSELRCFSESILFMAKADIIVFARGWENSRGCSLENDIALAYDKEILYETDIDKELKL